MWKIVGMIESRSGDVQFLPEWSIGSPNEFNSKADAETIRAAMQDQIERQRHDRSQAGAGGAGPAIRYVCLPAIDESLISQLHGGAPVQAAKPQLPALSFNSKTPPSAE